MKYLGVLISNKNENLLCNCCLKHLAYTFAEKLLQYSDMCSKHYSQVSYTDKCNKDEMLSSFMSANAMFLRLSRTVHCRLVQQWRL